MIKNIRITAEKDPVNLKWNVDVDVVAECTGFFTTKDSTRTHRWWS
jgi:glyceraldehyde 3-phosphate dehydrogenase